MAGRNEKRDDGTEDITTIMVPQISDTMDEQLLQDFQDTFAEAVGVTVGIHDVEGHPITARSRVVPGND